MPASGSSSGRERQAIRLWSGVGVNSYDNGHPPIPPMFLVYADSKEVTDADLGSADSKGVAGGRLRVKHGKTRSWLVSADSKGVRREDVKEIEEVEEVNEKQIPACGRDGAVWGASAFG